MSGRPLAATVFLLGLAGCFAPSGAFVCASADQCQMDGRTGTCEATGYCSYPDSDCESGRRYGDSAGALAGLCVGSEVGEPDGGGGDGVDGPDPLYGVYFTFGSHLVHFDPGAGTYTVVGAFDCIEADAGGSMEDLAIDRDRRVVGATAQSLFTIDAATATCTHLADLTDSTIGPFPRISFVPAAAIARTGSDVLVWMRGSSGEAYEIDPATGTAALLRQFFFPDPDLSIRDLVSVDGFGSVAVVGPETSAPNDLLRLDLETGDAQPLSQTASDLAGLGFWAGTLYGCRVDGAASEIVRIDPDTGAASTVVPGIVLGESGCRGGASSTVAPAQ